LLAHPIDVTFLLALIQPVDFGFFIPANPIPARKSARLACDSSGGLECGAGSWQCGFRAFFMCGQAPAI
jgi:hypothetical protein